MKQNEQQIEWITRAEFARRIAVSKTMVTRYVSWGLPLDEKRRFIPWPQARVWVEQNVVKQLSGNWAYRQLQVCQPRGASPAQRKRTNSDAPRPEEARAYRRLLNHLHRQAAQIPEILGDLGVKSMPLLMASPDIFSLVVAGLAGTFDSLAYPEYDQPLIIPPDFSQLALKLGIEGNSAKWLSEADALAEKLGAVLLKR